MAMLRLRSGIRVQRAMLVGAGLMASLALSSARAAEISYERQIRPILSNACFQCHGPDEAARKAGLRLDLPEAPVAGADKHAVIVAGKPDESELIKRITSADPDELMPPAESKKTVSADEIALIREWIAQGARRSTHWAFVAPVQAAAPAVSNAAWVRNPIDAFVLARLEAESLAPSAEADRATLLRRLSLDLTGLLPTVEETEQVLADTSPQWYEALVDRLLASPHYGERWARHWMDAAQYADSDGFEKDKPRQVWAWRDWVINAFNANTPYDRFVIEQVAGDLMPNATRDQVIATGFLRNSMINEEGGIDPEQFRMEAQFNRMDIIGRAVLGLTVQCAQCHTHKYDPLTHTEYYRMLSFLNNASEACDTVYSPAEIAQRESILTLVRGLEDGVKQTHPDWPAQMEAWAGTIMALPQPAWETIEMTYDDSSTGGQKFTPQGDGSYLAQGYAPTQFHPKMTGVTRLQKITAVRIELLTDPNLPRGGPGRSIYGTCALSEFAFRYAPKDTPTADFDKWTAVKLASAVADVNPDVRQLGGEYPDPGKKNRVTGPVAMAIDDNGDTAWSTDIDPERRNTPHYAIFKLAEPLTVPADTALMFRISQLHGGANSDDNQTNNLGRFLVSVTDADALPELAPSDAVRAAASIPQESRTPEQEAALFAAWRETLTDSAEINSRIASLMQGLPSGATQLVLRERETPRVTHRLDRGDFLSPKEEVEPGVPAFLNALHAEGAPDRLDFAKWLVARDAPTTARAFVNRVWQQYFGQGLVATSSDFGTQGDAPSHPELLDWLAVEFMESGWDVKALHKRIVTSSAYRQASKVDEEILERDPYNKLIARGARYRVEGETVRDIALAASGLLNPAIGGPSVYPPAPDFLFKPPASYGPKTWRVDAGAAVYRRGMYTFRFRSVPYPALQAFDTPAGDAPCTRRVRSNTPLQALTTLNEPVFFACSLGLAEAVLANGGATDRDRIAYAFRRCITRQPGDDEITVMQKFLVKQHARLVAGEVKAAEILEAGGGRQGSVAASDAELAAWTLVARAILNLDETITRE